MVSNGQARRALGMMNNKADLAAVIAAAQKESLTGVVVPPQNGIGDGRWSALKKAVIMLGAENAETQFLNRGEKK
jgi:hypothetical protein